MAVVTARGLRKAFGATVALDSVDLTIDEGRIVGLIGPNGAGKSTALGAILGLIPFEGELEVLGRNPWTARDELMRDVCFIADVAVLPRWMKVSQALDYVAGVHPRFDRAKAEGFLAKTTIKRTSRVRALSKGMVAQLHLALVMAIDAKLLVLDEPTLGLDLLYRKAFYDTLLNDYFDGNRTIIVTTHQVEEIQDILTDIAFIDRGRIVLNRRMEDIESRYTELMARPGDIATARSLGPIHERQVFGRCVMLFDGVARERLEPLGEVRTPGIADLFVALMGAPASRAPRSRRMTAATMSAQAPTRPFYWSVRRELWEHRSIYLGPAIAAGVVLLGFILSVMQVSHVEFGSGDSRINLEALPYLVVGGVVLATSLLVAFAYCLSALNAEKRDRSILFWKSLPVSDLTTILSKSAIPLAVIPVVAMIVTLAAQLVVMVLLSVSGRLGSRRRAGQRRRDHDQHPDLRAPGALAVVRAGLRLAAAGLELGQARRLPLGDPAAAGSLRARGNRPAHPPLRRPAGPAPERRFRSGLRHGRAGRHGTLRNAAGDPGAVLHQSRPVGRPARGGRLHRRRGVAAPAGRAGLTSEA